MGHHYVPQFYLKGFEFENGIWTYEKNGKPPFCTQIKSIANETNLYSGNLEGWLNNEIEIPAQTGIRNIRKHIIPTVDEKRALANYICIMWKRVPRHREYINEIFPEVAAEIRSEIYSSIDELALKSSHLTPSIVEEKKAFVATIIKKDENDLPAKYWHQNIESDRSVLVDILLGMKWNYFYNEKHQFLTSDNPLFYFKQIGINHEWSELTFPISSFVALWINRSPMEMTHSFRRNQIVLRRLIDELHQ
ncbi:MAG: DUF4238 domain-containing protein [Nitrosospira sp.]|nr:DUF4238 domain-containing protein [Nitrosospira sp.]